MATGGKRSPIFNIRIGKKKVTYVYIPTFIYRDGELVKIK